MYNMILIYVLFRSVDDVEAYRKLKEITLKGRDVPNPVQSFLEVGFPSIIVNNLS